MSKRIKVTDRLPAIIYDPEGYYRNDSEKVLTINDKGSIFVCVYCVYNDIDIDSHWLICGPDGYKFTNVVAWMEIPKYN